LLQLAAFARGVTEQAGRAGDQHMDAGLFTVGAEAGHGGKCLFQGRGRGRGLLRAEVCRSEAGERAGLVVGVRQTREPGARLLKVSDRFVVASRLGQGLAGILLRPSASEIPR